ncbi:MAG: hypothetical protein HC782_01220 [Gammaproteobacteria bacterium]|nr:hypothetical protein [Gammaproteobacteria bacterium]
MQNASATITALNDPAANDQSLASVLLESAAKILQPLVRLLITHGVTYQMASELLKRVYVDTAREHFVDKDTSDTRLSLLTGINRKEIRRLCRDNEPQERVDGITSFASAIHTMWRNNPAYLDETGSPRILPRRAVDAEVSFDRLIRLTTTDYRPSSMLHELLRLGVVEVIPAVDDTGEHIRLMPDAFLSRNLIVDRLLPMTETLQDHSAAAIANILSDKPIFLDRYIAADELTKKAADILHKRTRELWQGVYEELSVCALKYDGTHDAEPDNPAAASTTRIRAGMYFFAEDIAGVST